MPKRLTPRGEAAPPVEPIVTGATLPTKEEVAAKKTPRRRQPKETESGIRYVRNLHHIPSRVTLVSKREIMLHPRGQREDIDVVSAEEQNDPKFLANKDLLFEVLTVEQAKAIIYKQQTNSKRGSELASHFRNSKGKEYDPGTVGGLQQYGGQSVTVAQIQETGGGRFTDKNVAITRSAGANYVDAPGSPGHKATEFMQSVPSHISPEEYHEFLLWKQFKDAQDAAQADES